MGRSALGVHEAENVEQSYYGQYPAPDNQGGGN